MGQLADSDYTVSYFNTRPGGGSAWHYYWACDFDSPQGYSLHGTQPVGYWQGTHPPRRGTPVVVLCGSDDDYVAL